jgi:hypothetical protein
MIVLGTLKLLAFVSLGWAWVITPLLLLGGYSILVIAMMTWGGRRRRPS